MGIYIGIIEKKGYDPTVFFNFKPIAEIQSTQVIQLTAQEQEALLPESEKRNICFTYNWNVDDERRRMDANFSEKSLVLFEFTLEDLQSHSKANGDRYQTGYKVSAMKMLDEGKIRPVGNFGVYFAVRKNEVVSDFTNDTIVEIESPCVLAGNQVFIEMDDFWAGPYEVGYREYTSSYYVKPQIKEHKYTVSGYSSNQIKQYSLSYSEGYWGAPETQWLVLCPKQDATPEQLDVISDSVLVESFKDSIESGITANGLVKIDDVPALLKHYEESEIMGAILTDETRRSRLNRLVNIMSSEEDVDDTLRTITDFICDLLVKYQDSPNVDKWLQALVEKHPQLLDQLQSSQAISKHITELEDKLETLTTQRGELEKEIEETRQRAVSIDQQAIEAKKREMLEREEEYEALSARIEASKKLLGVVGDIDDLQKKYENLSKEVDHLGIHKSYLTSETNSLELQFQQLISRPHEKMVELAFDGFMASKMLRAAAEWENEQTNNQYVELTDKVASIPTPNKTPEELIEYLCRVIQIRRPNYSKNAIISIAICLTQGFLTVFSGDPGCGKTSICNIFGEALGLNKIADMIECPADSKEMVGRYVAVSVERGWTSKRDFVGYYNPLSKTFDKSNRRIYDALHQLDTEKQAGILKLPYIILLDEANLSPMEYYWSDFMNICDDLGPHSKVNLGEDYVFGVPETLHFVATINNDHTTETLSPRLIDRAWIITLPQLNLRDYSSLGNEANIPAEEVEVISWKSLRDAFTPAKDECFFTPELQKCYDSIVAKLREKKFTVSPRIDIAIKRYWAIASKYFEMDDTKTAAPTIALDYAIAQRILPKIGGNGEEFEKWLKEFSSLCSSNGLNTSAAIVKDIIERGNQQMKYYQFFC
ncbi:MAG: hypothetical protein H9864_07915 [Candidatus Faecalibacterium intestinavium]|uniref:AAA+ ATPase domain-containing protein n=1 Tax=Candidatus Faecalibacterium intestinavium TaxID=2838580 RepID=A0A9E2KKU7_9FIRM|nr:hypothetical protein [Candidatus Faecalibacterium intestinavium]